MSDHRAEAHADPLRSAIALTFGGWMAAAVCSLASADAPVADGSPTVGESVSLPSTQISPESTAAATASPASDAHAAYIPFIARSAFHVELAVPHPTDPPAGATSPLPAPPEDAPAPAAARAVGDREYFLEAGIGQTFGPSTFLLSATGGKFIDPELAIGPTLQLGIDDDETIFAPTFGVRRTFDLDSSDLRKLEPYLEGGVGFAYLEDDRRGGDEDDIGFLLTFGMGANFELQPNLALGTNILVNLMPGEVLDERLFVSWRILQLNFTF